MARALYAFEMAQNYDRLELETGFDYNHIAAACEKYNISVEPLDAELTAFVESMQGELREEMQAEEQEHMQIAKPSDEVLTALLADVKKLGKVAYERNGTMKWEHYLAASKLHTQYEVDNTMQTLRDIAARRRTVLQEGDMKEYSKLLKQWLTIKNM